MINKRIKASLDDIHKFLSSSSIRKATYRNSTYYCLNDIILLATDSVNPKDYIKKLRNKDRVLSIEWTDLIRLLPGETDGGPQNMKFVDIQSFLRIIQCVPGFEAHKLKSAIATIAAQLYKEMLEPGE